MPQIPALSLIIYRFNMCPVLFHRIQKIKKINQNNSDCLLVNNSNTLIVPHSQRAPPQKCGVIKLWNSLEILTGSDVLPELPKIFKWSALAFVAYAEKSEMHNCCGRWVFKLYFVGVVKVLLIPCSPFHDVSITFWIYIPPPPRPPIIALCFYSLLFFHSPFQSYLVFVVCKSYHPIVSSHYPSSV